MNGASTNCGFAVAKQEWKWNNTDIKHLLSQT